jgi:hypothetical protein
MDGVVLSWAAQVVRLAGCPAVEVLHACTHASGRKALPSWTGREWNCCWPECFVGHSSRLVCNVCQLLGHCSLGYACLLGMLACCVASLRVANLSQHGQGLAGSVNLDAWD